MLRSLVGSEMCIRDRSRAISPRRGRSQAEKKKRRRRRRPSRGPAGPYDPLRDSGQEVSRTTNNKCSRATPSLEDSRAYLPWGFCEVLCDRDGQTFVNIFIFFFFSATTKTQKCSFCDAESHKERDDGAYLLKKHLIVSDIYKVISLIPPLSKRCQDPRRLRVVGTYL